jgi:hypothetical protein
VSFAKSSPPDSGNGQRRIPDGHLPIERSAAEMDPSLKPDPLRKGSYYRRLEDVARGLQSLQSGGLLAPMRFFVDYFGCEKIARGLVGIHARWPATKAYHHRQSLRLGEIQVAAAALALPVSAGDLQWLFADFSEQHLLQSSTPSVSDSARYLRNKATHDFGPSHIALVAAHAQFLNPKLQEFLACVPVILAYQKQHFSTVP